MTASESPVESSPRVVVVTNPRSRLNRKHPHLAGELSAILGSEGAVVTPPDLEALDRLAPHLARAQLLAVHGGDGTLHRVLTALHRAGEVPPPVLLLRGGTMNIVADSVGNKVEARQLLEQVVRGDATDEQVRHQLEVDLGDRVVVGFLAGGGIISRFLELYYETDTPTPLDAARLLGRGALSALVGGRTARRLTRPYTGSLALDGEAWPGERWLAVAVGTVEELGLGFRPFPKVATSPGCMQVVGISSGIGTLATELPSVFLGRGVRRPGNREALCQTLELTASEPIQFMVDGDFHSGARTVTLRVGAPVRFVVPA